MNQIKYNVRKTLDKIAFAGLKKVLLMRKLHKYIFFIVKYLNQICF